MNVLLVGSGGREHALAWKIAQSSKVTEVFVAPGNAGTAGEKGITNLAISSDDISGLLSFALENNIGLTVIGPEAPLVAGIVDRFSEAGLRCFGPSQLAAQLEGSKAFAKDFLARHKIPTAAYGNFTDIGEAVSYVKSVGAPIVVKADGLAAGKGVIIAQNEQEAIDAVNDMLAGNAFGDAGHRVVIEEFLEGIELSIFTLTDGDNYVILPEAKDYKRIHDGDKGLNTGGMGAVSPVPFAQGEFLAKVRERIIEPTMKGIKNEGYDYSGFVFFGLINVNGEPFVIEYNVRMGDPETEVVLPRLKNDFVKILQAMANGTLDNIDIEIDERAATTIMLVSGGYPEAYEKGKEITGVNAIEDSILFHAGAILKDGKIVTSGGRVMAITSYGNTYQEAIKKSYQNIEKLHFDKMNYRKDIGFDL